ncbi:MULTISPECIES: serine hydrolase [Emticicia]|uniref:serine hydrolase n=1 Tax=Emticicia TaxID=312278 RepID=UPI0009EEF11F|nr:MULTISPECIES: serine hydrolase [Emticicia]
MKILTKLVIMSVLMNTSMAQSVEKKIDNSKISNYLSKIPSGIKVTMAVENMEGKSYFKHRIDVKVPSASVIKVPILMSLMEKVQANELSLSEEHSLTNAEKAGWLGEGIFMSAAEGEKFTIRKIAEEMIRTSDNTATNILIRKIGMETINQNLTKWGTTKTRLNRVMMDIEAVKQGRENYVNALEINALLRMIYDRKVANPILCDEMIGMLKNCEDTTTIPSQLPKDLAIAHKTGTLAYVRGDAAIVFTTQPFVISIFVEGFDKEATAEKIIGDLAKICWESLK